MSNPTIPTVSPRPAYAWVTRGSVTFQLIMWNESSHGPYIFQNDEPLRKSCPSNHTHYSPYIHLRHAPIIDYELFSKYISISWNSTADPSKYVSNPIIFIRKSAISNRFSKGSPPLFDYILMASPVSGPLLGLVTFRIPSSAIPCQSYPHSLSPLYWNRCSLSSFFPLIATAPPNASCVSPRRLFLHF